MLLQVHVLQPAVSKMFVEYPMRFNPVAMSKQITVFPDKQSITGWELLSLLLILNMNQYAETCTCGRYMEIGSLVLYDQVEISNLLYLIYFGGLLHGFFSLSSLYWFDLIINWLVVTYFLKMRQSNGRDKLRGHNSDITSGRYCYQVAKVQSLTNGGCGYDVFMNLLQFNLFLFFTAVKCTFNGVSVYWNI